MTSTPPPEDLHYTEEPEIGGDLPGNRSRELLERQSELEAKTVAYPHNLPIAFDAARGATIRDVDGNIFLDFFGGIGVANVGHSNPYVVEAVTEAIEDLVNTIDFPTEARIKFMEALDEIVPGDLSGNNRIVFGGPTGTNAIEAAIKLAKFNTGRSALVGFRGGYHGGTAGALSISAWSDYKTDFSPMLPDVAHLRYPYPFREGKSPSQSVEDSLNEVREAVSGERSGIPKPAAIFVEPIQGSGGVVDPPKAFFEGLEEIADANDTLLVVDEIQTGMARTGEWFASDTFGISPDAITVGKAIGGIGLPLSATVYDEKLDTWGPSAHAGTFRGQVPAMVAGTKSIEYIREHNLRERARDIGGYMRDRLREVAGESDVVGDVRGRGLLLGAEFVDGDGERNPAFVDRLQTYCFDRGLIVWKAGVEGSVLRLLPPLVVTETQARVGMDIITDGIRTLSRSDTQN